MPVTRIPLLLISLLLAGCAMPARQQQLEQVIGGLDNELQRLEEQLAAMNSLHYQKAIDAPLTLRQALTTQTAGPQGLIPVRQTLIDGPRLSYDYRLPHGVTTLPLGNPCLDYEFELRHLGLLGQLALRWQGASGQGERLINQRDCPFSVKGPGLQ